MQNAKLVIFDWDGTVMDTVPKIVNTIKLVAAAHSISPPPDDAIRAIIGLSLDVAIDTLFNRPEISAQLALTYKHAYTHLDRTEASLFPNVFDTLSALKERGYTLAVATGKSREGLDRLLSETGLACFFSATRTASECASKPSPEMILALCDELNIDTNATVMVGDTSMDLKMATNAQVKSIAVTFGAHTVAQLASCQPSHVIDRFNQLLDLL